MTSFLLGLAVVVGIIAGARRAGGFLETLAANYPTLDEADARRRLQRDAARKAAVWARRQQEQDAALVRYRENNRT